MSALELRCEGRVVDPVAGTDRRCGQRAGHEGACTRVRYRRRSRPRAKVVAVKRITRASLASFDSFAYVNELAMERPRVRRDCLYGGMNCERPCPWVACKHHLYLDINEETGSIKINFPDLEPWELQHTCALDVADAGGITLEEVGTVMNITRERVRQVEVRGLLKLKMGGALKEAA